MQEAFFRATFQAMGHLAKADGRVSEDEIRAARAMMSEFRLGEREVQLAIELFTQGKSRDFPLEPTLRELRQLCRKRPDLCRMFVQIQLQTALWGGSLNTASREVLARVVRGARHFGLRSRADGGAAAHAAGVAPPGARGPQSIASREAYEVLGVTHSAVRRRGHEGLSPADESESSRQARRARACRSR